MSQMLTVIITIPQRMLRSGVSLELAALVRRMGFDIILEASGGVDGHPTYQVTGQRDWALGDEGIATVKREIADLVYVYSGMRVLLGFGSIEDADV